MRIVHAISDLDPNRGGPPVVCAALATAEARLGHDVSIVCEARESSSGNDEIQKGLAVTFVPRQTLFGALYGRLDTQTGLFEHPVDLIHAHGVWNPIVLAAARVGRRRRIPYVISTHGALHPVCMRDRVAKKRTALAIGWRRMLRDAARVLCLNQPEATEANRIARADVSTVVPNGIDLAAVPPPDIAAFRARVPALADRPYFVFLGRLDRLKGLDLLFEAFVQYRRTGGNADLVVIGPDWGARSSLRALVHDANLESHVHVTGALYDATKFGALAGAIAFVHRPRYEAFGLAVLEAMAVGTPAIVSDACLLPLRDAEDGLVRTAADVQAFASALTRIASNPSERDILGARARAVIETHFDWGPIAQQTLRAAGLETPHSGGVA